MNVTTKLFRAMSEVTEFDRPDIRTFVLLKGSVYIEVTQFDSHNEPLGTVEIALSYAEVTEISVSLLVRYIRNQINTML